MTFDTGVRCLICRKLTEPITESEKETNPELLNLLHHKLCLALKLEFSPEYREWNFAEEPFPYCQSCRVSIQRLGELFDELMRIELEFSGSLSSISDLVITSEHPDTDSENLLNNTPKEAQLPDCLSAHGLEEKHNYFRGLIIQRFEPRANDLERETIIRDQEVCPSFTLGSSLPITESYVTPIFQVQTALTGDPPEVTRSETDSQDASDTDGRRIPTAPRGKKGTKKRSKKPNPPGGSPPLKVVSKMKRMNGEEYSGYKKPPLAKQEKIFRPKKSLGDACTKHDGNSRDSYRCGSVPSAAREQIFSEFWKMDWGQKKLYVRLMVTTCNVKRQTTNSTTKRRSDTHMYYLRVSPSGESVRVCKAMFLSTLGIKEGMFKGWMKSTRTSTISTSVPKERPYGCSQCKAKFTTPTAVETHTAKMHSKTKATCETCGRGFTTKYSLNKHIGRAHANVGSAVAAAGGIDPEGPA